ncbi:hypothetical protein GCM10017655_10670 [Pseudomonas turukhanskensis]|uniref:Uncharacterized protein n=1 Tax=Pseudomonas turukhanskensis TaxID=1806536 RepID=A0A9W6K1V6_9PSED|nr:hypothetical protein GCM10017655_10670 [Pseudomonas turukhanskensis]
MVTPCAGKANEEGCELFITGGWVESSFWLFSLYNKDELEDLNDEQRKLLKQRLQLEMKARTPL